MVRANCPDCTSKRKKRDEENKQEKERALKAEEEQIRASLKTDEGCLSYLEDARRRVYFGEEHDRFAPTHFERLRIALEYVFGQVALGNRVFDDALLDLYLHSIVHSKIREHDAYEHTQPPKVREKDAAWTEMRQLIQKLVRGLPPDAVQPWPDHLRSFPNPYGDRNENIYSTFHDQASHEALELLTSVALRGK